MVCEMSERYRLVGMFVVIVILAAAVLLRYQQTGIWNHPSGW